MSYNENSEQKKHNARKMDMNLLIEETFASDQNNEEREQIMDILR